jgi:hypothetical protein
LLCAVQDVLGAHATPHGRALSSPRCSAPRSGGACGGPCRWGCRTARCSGRTAVLTNSDLLFRAWLERMPHCMAVHHPRRAAARLGREGRVAPAPMGVPHGAMRWAYRLLWYGVSTHQFWIRELVPAWGCTPPVRRCSATRCGGASAACMVATGGWHSKPAGSITFRHWTVQRVPPPGR